MNDNALQVLDGRDESAPQARILLVSDNLHTHEPLGAELRRQGCDVHHVSTIDDALEACREADVILLDLDISNLEAIEICYKLREQSVVPLIVISNWAEEPVGGPRDLSR